MPRIPAFVDVDEDTGEIRRIEIVDKDALVGEPGFPVEEMGEEDVKEVVKETVPFDLLLEVIKSSPEGQYIVDFSSAKKNAKWPKEKIMEVIAGNTTEGEWFYTTDVVRWLDGNPRRRTIYRALRRMERGDLLKREKEEDFPFKCRWERKEKFNYIADERY